MYQLTDMNIVITDGIQAKAEIVHLFGSNYADICFGISSLDPQVSGWLAIWAIYATLVQYLPILISIGFVFLGFITKSTLVHFLSNIIQVAWITNVSLEYRFRENPIERECVASIRLGDIQLLGPVYALPPIEITQSIAISIFFIFYIFFWKRILVQHVGNHPYIYAELQDKYWMVIVFIILMIQNPLLLYIRGVYTMLEIMVAIIVGIITSANVIIIYVALAYMNSYTVNNQLLANGTTTYPLDNPFFLLHLHLIPLNE